MHFASIIRTWVVDRTFWGYSIYSLKYSRYSGGYDDRRGVELPLMLNALLQA